MPPPSPEHAWADMQERCHLPYLNKKKSWSKFRGSGWHYTLCISRCMPDTCRRPGAVARGCHAVKRVQNGLPSATSSCDTCTPVHPAQTPGRMFLRSFERKNVPRTRMSGTLRAQSSSRGVTCWATWSDKSCWTCLRRSLTRTLRVSFDESAMGVLSRSSLTEVSKGTSSQLGMPRSPRSCARQATSRESRSKDVHDERDAALHICDVVHTVKRRLSVVPRQILCVLRFYTEENLHFTSAVLCDCSAAGDIKASVLSLETPVNCSAAVLLRALPVSVKETGKLKSVFSWLLSNRRREVRPLEMRLPRPQPDVGRCHGSHFLPPPQHESCLSLRPPAVADCPEHPGILKL